MIDDEAAFAARDRCAIAGIGATEFSRDSGRSVLSLATEAARAALADAGLGVQDIDGIVSCDVDRVTPWTLAASLGATNLAYWAQTGPGGVAPSMMIGLAVGALLSGQAKAVLAFRSLNGRSEARLGSGVPGMGGHATVGGFGSYDEFFLPYGLFTAGAHASLEGAAVRQHRRPSSRDDDVVGRRAEVLRSGGCAVVRLQSRGGDSSLPTRH